MCTFYFLPLGLSSLHTQSSLKPQPNLQPPPLGELNKNNHFIYSKTYLKKNIILGDLDPHTLLLSRDIFTWIITDYI